MQLLACGNPALPSDNYAFMIADELAREGFTIGCITDPLQLLEYDLATCVLIDVAYGIKEPVLLTDVDKLKLSRLVSLHDFDVAYFLKLLKELGKLDALRIIAVPDSTVDDSSVLAKVRALLAACAESNNDQAA